MEKRINRLEEKIRFLYDELDKKDVKIDKLEDSANHANEICRKNTEYAQEILREKCQISQTLDKKEQEIYKLKKEKEENVCLDGCNQYNKSMDEVVYYTQKHKDSLIIMKTLAENQKSKISSLREERNKMMDQLDQQEIEMERENQINVTLIREKDNLSKRAKYLEHEIEDKGDAIKDLEVKMEKQTRTEATLRAEIEESKTELEALEKKYTSDIEVMQIQLNNYKDKEVSEKGVKDEIIKDKEHENRIERV